MRFKTTRATRHTLTLDDDTELELEFEPYDVDNVLAKRIGDVIVVGYIVHDDDGWSINPLKDYDCQGEIITRNQGVITDDDSRLSRELGLDSYGDPDIDREFPFVEYIDFQGKRQNTVCLWDLAAAECYSEVEDDLEGDFVDWLEDQDFELDDGETLEQAFAGLQKEFWKDLLDSNGFFCDRIEERARELYPEYWELIAGPYVIPLSYSSHSCGTSISIEDWDGDPYDPPNAIWVADVGAMQNIGLGNRFGITSRLERHWRTKDLYEVVEDRGREVARIRMEGGYQSGMARAFIEATYGNRPFDVRTASEQYAHGVAEEYAKWCSGEVFGVVTQVFRREGDDWVSEDADSCWGFIGQEWAMESLESDYYGFLINKLGKEANEPA